MTYFEGADFNNKPFKALMPQYYPAEYQEYISQEETLVISKLKGLNKVLDAGVGIGRLIPKIAPIVGELIGIDNADLMINKAKDEANKFSNVKIIKADIENLSHLFAPKTFANSLCLWNTLGNVADEVAVLKELQKITSGNIYLTVYLKGTLSQRKNWYATLGVELENIDEVNEVVYTKSGLRSKAYNEEDIHFLAKNSGLKVEEILTLNQVMLWVQLSS